MQKPLHPLLRSLWLFGVLLLIQLPQSGCTKNTYTGTIGKCTYTSGSDQICVEYSYAAEMNSDPATRALSESQAACTSSSGSFTAGGSCTKTGLAGSCRYTTSATDSGQTFHFTQLFHYPTSVANGVAVCGTLSGATWTAGNAE